MNLQYFVFVAFAIVSLGIDRAQGPQPQAAANPQNAQATVTDSSERLQSQIDEILNAIRGKDSAKETELIQSLLMPENSTWFVDEYGPGFGGALSAAYRGEAVNLKDEIKSIYEADARAGLLHAKISRYADPEAVNAPIDHFLNCMNQIVPLYEAAFLGKRPGIQMAMKSGQLKQTGGDLDGLFVYYQGAFRFIPMQILMKLPSERPVRIHLDMNVMRSKLTMQTYASYPEEALRKRIGGKVVVRVNLDMSGNIQDIKPVEGDPILLRALIDAVNQWRFLPTKLDGDPVEVELDVEMVFQVH